MITISSSLLQLQVIDNFEYIQQISPKPNIKSCQSIKQMTKPKKNKRTKSQIVLHSNQIKNQLQQSATKSITQPNTFKFISNNYSTHLQCPICHQLMIRPMRVHPCAHTFCSNCINPFMILPMKLCPFDQCLRKFQVLQNDRTAESLIDELKVACTNDGCVWKGEYDNYKKTHKDFCVFRNGGFNTWLNNLTQGIVLTQRNNREESTLDSSPYGHVPKSETLQPYIEQNSEEESQKLQQGQSHKLKHQQQGKKELQPVNTQEPDEQYKQERVEDYRTPNRSYCEIKQNDGVNISAEQEEKVQKQNRCGQNLSYQLDQSSNRSGINSNFNIFNMPFGPSIGQQMNLQQNRRNKLMQKQIKKVQG